MTTNITTMIFNDKTRISANLAAAIGLNEEACAVLQVSGNQEVSLLNLATFLRPHYLDFQQLVPGQ